MKAAVLSDALLARLKRTGNWMVRFSDDGIVYNSYRWPEIGVWAEAPDWNPEAVCGGGFHGQGPGGYGFCKAGSRFELCETKGRRVIVDGDKVKARHARILAVDGEAWTAIIALCDEGFPGSLDCRGYAHPLPALKSVGGYLDCRGYPHPLPALKSVGGYLDCRGYPHPLPALKSVGGYLDCSGYAHPLPALKSVGGYLYCRGYAHPLPALKSVGGSLDCSGYAHPLPALKSVGGYLDCSGYPHPLPALKSVGGYLDCRGYPHPLPPREAQEATA